jgi:hypothetical protein
MNLEERKRVEDKIAQLLESLTAGEKAVLYKTMHAQGSKIAECDGIIAREPAPEYARRGATAATVPFSPHLPRGLPPTSKFP